jgi:hypothetical protein
MKFAAEQTGSSKVGGHVLFDVRAEPESGEDAEQVTSSVRVSDTGIRAKVPGTECQVQVWRDDDKWPRSHELDEALALAVGEAAIRFKMVLDSASSVEGV